MELLLLFCLYILSWSLVWIAECTKLIYIGGTESRQGVLGKHKPELFARSLEHTSGQQAQVAFSNHRDLHSHCRLQLRRQLHLRRHRSASQWHLSGFCVHRLHALHNFADSHKVIVIGVHVRQLNSYLHLHLLLRFYLQSFYLLVRNPFDLHANLQTLWNKRKREKVNKPKRKLTS